MIDGHNSMVKVYLGLSFRSAVSFGARVDSWDVTFRTRCRLRGSSLTVVVLGARFALFLAHLVIVSASCAISATLYTTRANIRRCCAYWTCFRFRRFSCTKVSWFTSVASLSPLLITIITSVAIIARSIRSSSIVWAKGTDRTFHWIEWSFAVVTFGTDAALFDFVFEVSSSAISRDRSNRSAVSHRARVCSGSMSFRAGGRLRGSSFAVIAFRANFALFLSLFVVVPPSGTVSAPIYSAGASIWWCCAYRTGCWFCRSSCAVVAWLTLIASFSSLFSTIVPRATWIAWSVRTASITWPERSDWTFDGIEWSFAVVTFRTVYAFSFFVLVISSSAVFGWRFWSAVFNRAGVSARDVAIRTRGGLNGSSLTVVVFWTCFALSLTFLIVISPSSAISAVLYGWGPCVRRCSTNRAWRRFD